MGEFLRAGDVLAGREGTAYATIDGRNIPLLYLKTVEATVKLNKKELPVLGKRMNQQKVSGATGEGKMNVYRVTSEFAKIAVRYLKEGTIPNIDLKFTNGDPQSTIGRCTVLLRDVVLDTITLAKLDVDAESLDEDLDFSFSDADILEEFGELSE